MEQRHSRFERSTRGRLAVPTHDHHTSVGCRTYLDIRRSGLFPGMKAASPCVAVTSPSRPCVEATGSLSASLDMPRRLPVNDSPPQPRRCVAAVHMPGARPNGQFVAERVARFIGKTALAGEVSLGGREPKA